MVASNLEIKELKDENKELKDENKILKEFIKDIIS
jgi:cell division protein FtsB